MLRSLLALSLTTVMSQSPSPLDSPLTIIGADNLQYIEEVSGTPYYDMARSVARMETLDGDPYCTAFRVSANLFMTNYHCWQAEKCNAIFHLGYERGLRDDEQAYFRCTGLVDGSDVYDFALIRAKPVSRCDDEDYPPAVLTVMPVVKGQAVVAPGHPYGRAKQIDVSDQCRLVTDRPKPHCGRQDIEHQCDTDGGSSGSPLIDKKTGHVVAIHWDGIDDNSGNNHAIPMEMIIAYLRQKDPKVLYELAIVSE